MKIIFVNKMGIEFEVKMGSLRPSIRVSEILEMGKNLEMSKIYFKID